jgi:nitrite transporter NirC
MPLPLPESVDEAAQVAAGKAKAVRDLPRYLMLSMLAGAYVGVAIVLMLTAAGPLFAASNVATKLVSGCVFGIALTLVVFAGAELFTGNNMIMLIGWLRGRVSLVEAIAVNVASLVGNFLGALGFAGMVYASGILELGAKPAAAGKPAVAAAPITMLSGVVHSKMAAPAGQLFWRAVLCNMLVCLALWMASRATSDSAKLIVLFWGLLAFIAAGYDHCVANMTLFALAIFEGSAKWSDMGHNLLYTVPGNLVGGAVLVGLPYLLAQRRPTDAVTGVGDVIEEESEMWSRHRRAPEPATT